MDATPNQEPRHLKKDSPTDSNLVVNIMTQPTDKPQAFDETEAWKLLTPLGYEPGDKLYVRGLPPKLNKKYSTKELTAEQRAAVKNATPRVPAYNSESLDEVDEWQSKGYGVYFVVNGGGRADKDVTECRAVFYEHDNMSKEKQLALWHSLGLPEPTIQVDTGGKSIHSYWVLKEPCSPESWKVLQTDLLDYSEGDKALKNPSRVMRLPGASHVSIHPDGRFEYVFTKVVGECGEKYSYDELAAKIPSKQPTNPNESPQGVDGDLVTFYKEVVLPKLDYEDVYTHDAQWKPCGDGARGCPPWGDSQSGTSFRVWSSGLNFRDAHNDFDGDAATYVHSMTVGKYEHPTGKDWVKALKVLADRAGVEMPRGKQTPATAPKVIDITKLLSKKSRDLLSGIRKLQKRSPESDVLSVFGELYEWYNWLNEQTQISIEYKQLPNDLIKKLQERAGIDDTCFEGVDVEFLQPDDEDACWKKLAKNFKIKNPEEEERQGLQPSDVVDILVPKYSKTLAWQSEYQLWFRYGSDSDGLWSEQTPEQMQRMVHGELDELSDMGYGAARVDSIVKLLAARLEVIGWDEYKALIPMRDGVLDAKTQELTEHKPEYHFTWQLPYNWADRVIGCDPIIKYFRDITGSKDVTDVLLAFMAATVTRRADLQRYLLLTGGGQRGKTTFMNLLIALVGANNVVSSQLSVLEKNQFEVASFKGKSLAVFPDSERWQGEVSNLKKLTGQDPIRYERKGVQRCKNFVFNGMVLITSNELIETSDKTSGADRRKLSVHLDTYVEKYDRPGMLESLLPYIPGLLEYLLTEFNEERIWKLIKHTNKYVPELAKVRFEHLIETNVVAAWAEKYLVVGAELKLSLGVKTEDYSTADKKAYDSILKFCHESGHSTKLASNKVSRALMDLFNNQLRIPVTKKTSERFHRGIGLRTEYDPEGKLPSPLLGVTPPRVSTGNERAQTYTPNGLNGFNELSQSQNREEKNSDITWETNSLNGSIYKNSEPKTRKPVEPVTGMGFNDSATREPVKSDPLNEKNVSEKPVIPGKTKITYYGQTLTLQSTIDAYGRFKVTRRELEGIDSDTLVTLPWNDRDCEFVSE